MNASAVLRLLASSRVLLSDGLRATTLLALVRNDADLLAWLNQEIGGYSSPVPDYRTHALTTVADAFNGVWHHRSTELPVHAFPDDLREYASRRASLTQGVGTLEVILTEGKGDSSISWDRSAVARLMEEVALGRAGINRTYQVSNVRWNVPRALVSDILEAVRHRALDRVAALYPGVEVDLEEPGPEADSEHGTIRVTGSSNQIVVGSPGAQATMSVGIGDWDALVRALESLDVPQDSISDLKAMVSATDLDVPTKVMRVLAWSKRTGKAVGLNTVGSAAAALVLKYLGLV